jgi:hypothetical protein
MARSLHSKALLSLIVFVGAAAVGCGSSSNGGKFVTSSGGAGGTAGADAGNGASGGAAGSADASPDGVANGGAAGASGSAGSANGGSAGSSAGGSSASGGAAGNSAGGGSASGGAGASSDAGSCTDTLNEPNETEDQAASLGAASCNGSAHTQQGVMALANDVDWYTFSGDGGTLCAPDVVASVNQSNLRVCVYAKCQTGTATRTCKNGQNATSPDGLDGCCAASGGKAELTLSCSGLTNNDAGTVYVRIDQPGHDACVDYQLTYSY